MSSDNLKFGLALTTATLATVTAVTAGKVLYEAVSKRCGSCCCSGKAESKAPSKRSVLVLGATGAQGGSVVKHLLADGSFEIRGLTRDPNAEKAVRLCKGDMSDLSSMEAAARGADYGFVVTQFWEKFDEDTEFKEGKNAIDALLAAGVSHIVLSTLPPSKRLSNISVPHFDAKWRVAEYLQQRVKAFPKTGYTLIFPGAYLENFTSQLKKDDKGVYTFTHPTGGKPWPLVSVGDIGKAVTAILKQPANFNGKLVDFYSENLTTAQIAAVWQEVSKTTSVPYEPTPEAFAKFGFPGAEELAWMFAFYQWLADARSKGNPYRSLVSDDKYVVGKDAFPGLTTWKQFAQTLPK